MRSFRYVIEIYFKVKHKKIIFVVDYVLYESDHLIILNESSDARVRVLHGSAACTTVEATTRDGNRASNLGQ